MRCFFTLLSSIYLAGTVFTAAQAGDYPEMEPNGCTYEACGYVYRSQKWTPEFEEKMKKAIEGEFLSRFPGGQMKECKNFVHLAAGTANGNHSYGATCDVAFNDRFARYTMCTSQMVEHFALTKRYFNVDEIAVFTYLHCTGG